MATKIGFWTPIKYEDQSTSLGQKIREFTDFYFYLEGRVAIVIPGVTENGSIGAKVQEDQSPGWKTALKVASYFTVILPILIFVVKVISRAFYPFHECQRTPPDGTHEARTFVNGVLQQGVRTQGGQTAFLRPKLLLGEVTLKDEGIELNFAEVTIDGRTEIIPVQRPYQQGTFGQYQQGTFGQYIRYPGSQNEALLKIAQDNTRRFSWSSGLHYGSPIKFVLEHENNRLLQTKEFLTYLLTPNDDGRLPLHTVNKSSLLEILDLARSNSIVINLETVDPITHETLFSKWTGTGDVRLTQALLRSAPSAIRQTEGREESFFVRAVLGGFEDEAQVLWQAMQAERIEPTQADRWIQKAFTNDCNFTDQEFIQLPIELQQKMFKTANIGINREFLHKLRDFGMHQPPAQPERAGLFSYNMDAIDVEQTLQTFLGNLRRAGLLLTKEEFAQKDRARYYYKGDDIGLVLGRDYIERTANCLNLPYIKVHKKIAVIQPEDDQALSLEFTVSRDGGMDIMCRSLQIYAEMIEPIEYKATRKEMMGLLDLIEATGFNDFFGHNLFMGKNHNGKQGIYFIDPGYSSFSSLPSYDNIESLSILMAQEDHSWLQTELHRRLDFFRSQRAARAQVLQEKCEQQKPVFIENGFADRRKPFVFNIVDLVKQEVREEAANE
jgi:hypothetical protein